MKKPHIFSLILLYCIFFFNSCKKGEEDPKFTLLTRKSRVDGRWKMVKGTASITSLQSNAGYSTYFTLDGSDYKRNETPAGGVPTVYLGKYSLDLVFKKDGSFSMSESYNRFHLEATGHWNFTSGVGRDKNKESINITLNSVTNDESDGHLFNRFSTEFSYRLVGLGNKEMRLEGGNPVYLNSNGQKLSLQCDYSFAQ